MSSRAVWVTIGLLGCGGDAPSARSRVLAKIPAGVTSIGVADGHALSHARFRSLVDVLRAEVPAGFDCVIDAALAGEQVAAGIAPSGDVTVALATKARVKCPALGQTEDGLWIATLGAGAPAAGATAASEQPRARPFLRDAPIAIVTTYRDLRVLATARPDPLAAWVAFDARDVSAATAFASELGSMIEAASASEVLAPVANAITIDRQGSQVVARIGAVDADLAIALREALARAHVRDTARAFPCPSPFAPPVLGCEQGELDHNKLEVYSLASALDEILAARKEVVIANGRASGVRLRDDLATYGLQSGDLLVAIDGKRVTAVEQVAPYLQSARARTSLMVGRLQRIGLIELVEQ